MTKQDRETRRAQLLQTLEFYTREGAEAIAEGDKERENVANIQRRRASEALAEIERKH